ncbi:MAG: DsrE family protein [Pseudomonadales bacterium]|nr:DsrE family protein [Pseudomonadales bacterium]
MSINKLLVLGFFFLSSIGQSHAEEKKAVFDLTSGDAEKIESRLLNGIKYISNFYKKQGDELTAVVVISGKSYKYFIEDLKSSPYKDEKDLADVQKKLRPLIMELNDAYGVRFEMCGAGMKMRGIKAESLYSVVHFDKAKPIYLIDRQNKGYAYMPVH